MNKAFAICGCELVTVTASNTSEPEVKGRTAILWENIASLTDCTNTAARVFNKTKADKYAI